MDSVPPPVISPSPPRPRGRFAVFLKVAGIGVLIVLLHVPLLLTHGVLRERQAYRRQAVEEITGIWGRAQLVTGPVLAVPYAYRTPVIRPKVVDGKVVQVEEMDLATATAYFLPEELAGRVRVEPEVRQRGIHEAVVYSTRLELAGSFRPDFAAAGIAADRIDWGRAQLLVGVSDVRGVRALGPGRPDDGRVAPFAAAAGAVAGHLPLAARVAGAGEGKPLEFALVATLQGSERLQVAPVGKRTQVTLAAPWADPSFGGAYLPVRREVGGTGFEAEWEIAHFSRGFPQAWTDRTTGLGDMMPRIGEAAFGVTFVQPVDGYRLAERAQKYGVLFFVLVFAVFFLFEVTAALRIHPLQYVMVGAALCLFFLGFLALSEFLESGTAYTIAAAACTVLVSAYAWSFLHTGARTAVIAGGLAATYGYLYFVLQSQDYALAAGTAALFAALALVMFGTRRINWYSLEMGAPAEPRPESGNA